jgi:hypothetical protein
VPDASQTFAVSLHAGASSRSVSAPYDWNYLAAAPCVLISMSNSYCYEVNCYGLMVVWHGVARSSLQTSRAAAAAAGVASSNTLLKRSIRKLCKGKMKRGR